MSENSTPEERTELPTDKKMSKLREDGQVYSSNEIVVVSALFSAFICLLFTSRIVWQKLTMLLVLSLKEISDTEKFQVKDLMRGFRAIVYEFGPWLLLIFFSSAIAAVLATFLQTNWNIKKKKVEFKFSALNPIQGIKKIISIEGLINIGKSLLKLGFILPIGYFALLEIGPKSVSLLFMDISQILAFMNASMVAIFWKMLYILIPIAIFDYFYGRYRWLKENKMTKEEVKDESKATEGDESTKRKIKAKGLNRIAQRIADAVPRADVVVTNPTHFAVALQYDSEGTGAPKVVAKGQDFLALRIREIAKKSGVPIVERKQLARSLYASVEVEQEIPYELFKAVAEVLAYVYRLKGKKGF